MSQSGAEGSRFSAVVRIQVDRGHSVCSSGPYRIVRHPGYAGGLLAFVATPLVLQSLWAFVPALGMIAIAVVRTALEDRTLHEELAGYASYAEIVRFRLVPGIW